MAARKLSIHCHFLCVQGYGEGGSTALKLVGQRPSGELGFCGFVGEFGVSGDEMKWS